MSQGTSVSIETGLGAERLVFDSRRGRVFPFSTKSRPTLGPT